MPHACRSNHGLMTPGGVWKPWCRRMQRLTGEVGPVTSWGGRWGGRDSEKIEGGISGLAHRTCRSSRGAARA